jgi:hypothetical protein
MPKALLSIIALAALGAPVAALATGMQSPSYGIMFDSLNGGGGLSSSDNYSLEDTLGEQATGLSASDTYGMRAGYQQMDSSFISITAEGDVVLPPLSGITAATSSAAATWTVITDAPAGYSLYVRATSSPALQGGGGAYFADYDPVGADPDFAFSVPSGESRFGFSVEGDDLAARFLDNGSACGTGSSDAVDRCYDGFSTTDAVVASRDSRTATLGSDVSLRFAAGVGPDKIQDATAYAATIILTAIPN